MNDHFGFKKKGSFLLSFYSVFQMGLFSTIHWNLMCIFLSYPMSCIDLMTNLSTLTQHRNRSYGKIWFILPKCSNIHKRIEPHPELDGPSLFLNVCFYSCSQSFTSYRIYLILSALPWFTVWFSVVYLAVCLESIIYVFSRSILFLRW